MQKQTTIRVSTKLLEALKNFKEDNKDTYEEIIWDFIEPHLELSDEAKRDIKKSKEEYKRGDYVTHEEIKAQFRLK